MQQILRLCEVVPVDRPRESILSQWLGRPLKAYESQMDLRQLLRGDDAIVTTFRQQQVSSSTEYDDDDDAVVEETPQTYNAAWFSLYNSWDIYGELDLETKDANLAGLLFHQNLPRRLAKNADSWLHYKRIHSMCAESDLADYWAFFHQCWVLLNISNNFKLKFPSQYLQNAPFSGTVPEAQSLEYTWVLTKQSALFNTWKEMLRINEQSGVSLRLISDYTAVIPASKYTAAIALTATAAPQPSTTRTKKSTAASSKK
jgi:hypothetical protein